jgi:hypothetical protein
MSIAHSVSATYYYRPRMGHGHRRTTVHAPLRFRRAGIDLSGEHRRELPSPECKRKRFKGGGMVPRRAIISGIWAGAVV